MNHQLNQVFTLFLCLFLQALPFLLLGIVFSSWLLVFVNQRQLLARLPHNPILEVFLGSCLGLFLPVCQYGNIPLARRFLIHKFPVPLVISFLLASPTINPLVIWLTIKAFPQQPEIVWLRLVFAWLIALIVGFIFISYKGKKNLLTIENNQDNDGIILEPTTLLLQTATFLPMVGARQPLLIGSKIHVSTPESQNFDNKNSNLYLFLDNFIKELFEFGGFLIIGSLIAAIIQVFFLKNEFLFWNFGTESSWQHLSQILSPMLFGIVSSFGAINNTLTITNLTDYLTTGSLISLLLFSSIFDLKSIFLMIAAFRYKEIIYLFLLTFQLVFFFGLSIG